ncbi:hypothetical protein J2Y00_001879 [Deinococcus soli (ex Cha et al. 2016)]|uniref:Uncharacterized protein n=2 Tax=Deinococcus soli (ex Cha et al. 2016) TaxID=1309411 RepID=A0AAE4BN36_9DEIO|nr:hypothetical protein [Deinococcus soli (ex Cha et al. 2016)]MDR6329056.1 hypothetical protein [Deinococcus soli (ex Cha et al. 2016)]MDR6751329.1 hypothetical protein [Deinococcus soli (ex Cha et al. 2016)]
MFVVLLAMKVSFWSLLSEYDQVTNFLQAMCRGSVDLFA